MLTVLPLEGKKKKKEKKREKQKSLCLNHSSFVHLHKTPRPSLEAYCFNSWWAFIVHSGWLAQEDVTRIERGVRGLNPLNNNLYGRGSQIQSVQVLGLNWDTQNGLKWGSKAMTIVFLYNTLNAILMQLIIDGIMFIIILRRKSQFSLLNNTIFWLNLKMYVWLSVVLIFFSKNSTILLILPLLFTDLF